MHHKSWTVFHGKPCTCQTILALTFSKNWASAPQKVVLIREHASQNGHPWIHIEAKTDPPDWQGSKLDPQVSHEEPWLKAFYQFPLEAIPLQPMAPRIDQSRPTLRRWRSNSGRTGARGRSFFTAPVETIAKRTAGSASLNYWNQLKSCHALKSFVESWTAKNWSYPW